MTDLNRAKADPDNRNQYLEQHRSFIRATACAICGRPLEWGRDEELSIALMAFNAAIDAWTPQGGASFKSFARTLIKRRLIDYFRQQQRHSSREQPVAELPVIHGADDQEEFQRLERAWEIRAFEKMMGRYDITFAMLANESPSHQGVRERLLQAVKKIDAEPGLTEDILSRGRLPLEHLVQVTGMTKKMLAKRRRYLLALLAVRHRLADFPFIGTYLGLGGKQHD